MDELLDIVDENDNVIGKDTRENVHAAYQIHRGVHVLIVNAKGEILVQKRAAAKSDRPGYLDASVGAHVQSGESYEQAAVRESVEELGYTPSRLEFVAKYNSFSERQREIRVLYFTRAEGPFVPDPAEVEVLYWMTIGELDKKPKAGELFTEGFLKSLGYYKEHLSVKRSQSLLKDMSGTF